MSYALLSLAGCCVGIPLYLSYKHGLLALVSPLMFVCLFAVFGILLKLFAYLIKPEIAYFSFFVRGEDPVFNGYLYVTLFILAVCVGYVAGIKRNGIYDLSELTRIAPLTIVRPYLLLYLSTLVFLIVTILFLNQHGIAGVSELFSITAIHDLNSNKIVRIEGVKGFGRTFAGLQALYIIPKLAFAMFYSVYCIRPSKKNGLPSLLTFAMWLLIVLVSGRRMEIFNMVICILSIKMILDQRVNLKLLFKILLGILLVLVLFSFMTTLRVTKGDLSFSWDASLLTLLNILDSTYFLDVNMPIVIVDRFNTNHCFNGSSYFWWIFGWIPRDLWPGKPAVTLGPYVKQHILGLYGSVGGVNPTGPGEAFINFGWYGCLVGIVLGYIYRKLEEFLLDIKMILNGGGIWLYPLLFLPFIGATLQSSFSGFIVTAMVQYVLVWLMIRITTVRLNIKNVKQMLLNKRRASALQE